MKHSKQDLLLKEIFSGEDLAEFRSASLDRTLAYVRIRQRRRRILRVGSLLMISVLLIFLIFQHAKRYPTDRVATQGTSHEPQGTARLADANQTRSGGIRFISDEELFALFPDRPLALIGSPGRQRLVFLGESKVMSKHDLE